MMNIPTSIPLAWSNLVFIWISSTSVRLSIASRIRSLERTFRTYPQTAAADFAQHGTDDLFGQSISPADAFKRFANISFFQQFHIPVEPTWIDGEDVVRIPKLIRVISLNQPGHLLNHFLWVAPSVGEAKYRMAAPIAYVWTSSGRN